MTTKKIYVPSDAQRVSTHDMYISPGNDTEFTKGEVPKDWLDHEGKPATITVTFVNGVAEVDSRIADYMVERGLARKTKLILPGDSHA